MASTAGDYLCERPANPALTIMALASRLAARMASGAAMDDDQAARPGRAGRRR